MRITNAVFTSDIHLIATTCTHRTPAPLIPSLLITMHYLPLQVVPGTVDLVEMIECPSDEYRLHEPPCPKRGPISHAPSLYGPRGIGATLVVVQCVPFI